MRALTFSALILYARVLCAMPPVPASAAAAGVDEDALPGRFSTQLRLRNEYERSPGGRFNNVSSLILQQSVWRLVFRADVPVQVTNADGSTRAGLGDVSARFGIKAVDRARFQLEYFDQWIFPSADTQRPRRWAWSPRLIARAWLSYATLTENELRLRVGFDGDGSHDDVVNLRWQSRLRVLLPHHLYVGVWSRLSWELTGANASTTPTFTLSAELGGRWSAVGLGVRGTVHVAGPVSELWVVQAALRVYFKRWLFVP